MSTTDAPDVPDTPSFKTSYLGRQLFFGPDCAEWRDLSPEESDGADAEKKQKIISDARAARESLKGILLSSLQMQHVVVLAGCGTSLGDVTKGPSMWALWDYCVNKNAGGGKRERTALADAAIAAVGYSLGGEKAENIEDLLSRCEAFLAISEDENVSKFVAESKKTILQKCSEFIDPRDQDQLKAHRTFLHRLSRRRARDSRLKLFTTNYDLCFEIAAGKQGLVVLDGFSFTQPRHFDPRFFLYDIVRRPSAGDETGTPLEGVFHLFKLHGSVNWSRNAENEISVADAPSPESACLIYPAKGKYQQSYVQPHLELVANYFSALREPNTCLIVSGFGFNDDHLSEPILAAVRTNPHLRLIVVNPSAADLTSPKAEKNRYWESLYSLASQGEDVWFVNATFGEFAEMIPDLKSLTPAQRLTRDIKQMVGGQ